MSYKIIENIDNQQFATVFKIEKKEGYKGVKLNRITTQNTLATFSYNNNAIRFIRLGIDYRHKPLKHLFKGNYNKFRSFYLLNQVFLPAHYQYITLQDCQIEINNIMTRSILDASLDVNKRMYMYYNNESNYNLIIEGITGAPKIPNLSTSISNIDTPMLYFRRQFKNELYRCDCLRNKSKCCCKNTPELNCYLPNDQSLTNANFIVLNGTQIDSVSSENTTLIFMNLNKTRLSQVVEKSIKNIYLQNGDELLVITESDNTTTQTMIKINNITSTSTLMVAIKEYYLCLQCMICSCCNEYDPEKGVYSLNYTIDNEEDSIKNELDIYLKDCDSSIVNGQVVFSNDNFNIAIDSTTTIEYIIEKKTVKTCSCGNKIPIYSESKFNDDVYLNYVLTIDNNLIQDYVITGWKIKIDNIEMNNNTLTINYNPFKYKTVYSDSTHETLKSVGQITFSTQNGATQNGATSNFPNINIVNWKTSDVIFDELFFNMFINDGYFMKVLEHDNFEFSSPIIPVEFDSNFKPNLPVNYQNILTNYKEYTADNRFKTKIIPPIFEYSVNLLNQSKTSNTDPDLNVIKDGQDRITMDSSDYLNYMYTFMKIPKFYVLFSQFQRSGWFKLGVIPDQIKASSLSFALNRPLDKEGFSAIKRTSRIYNILGITFTQELFLSDTLIVKQDDFDKKHHCKEQINYLNPTQFSKQDLICNNASTNDNVNYSGELKVDIPTDKNNTLNLYKDGVQKISNISIAQLYSTIGFNNNVYSFIFSFTDNIDKIINNFIDTTEYQKQNIKYTTATTDEIKFELEFKNLVYNFDNEINQNVWLYIDSQYHYPLINGSKAYLEIEYIPYKV